MDELIGHASGDERGKLRGGKAGEQNGREVYTRGWYNRPWNCVIEFTDPVMAEKNAVAMEHACANGHIGYNQDQRNTLLVEARKYGYDPGKVKKNVETDCSALAALCCMYAGIPESALVVGGNSAYTGNLRSLLVKTGKVKVYTDKKHLKSGAYNHRGAILLYEGHHVAIQLEDGSEVKKEKQKEITEKKTETTFKAPNFGVVTAELLNVRHGAGSNYPVLKTTKKGNTVLITKMSGKWGYAPELKGWLSTIYLKVDSSVTVKVTADALNVREKASSGDTKIVTVIKKGDKVTITKVNSSGTWGYVKSLKGWISLKYVTY